MSKQRARVLLHFIIVNLWLFIEVWVGVGLMYMTDLMVCGHSIISWQGQLDFDYVMCHPSFLIPGKCPAPHLWKNTVNN